MMEISTNQWHAKLYLWCREVWDEFAGKRTDRSKANLCQYIRSIFILMPLAIIVNLGFWLYVLYVSFYIPVTRFGLVGTVKAYMVAGLLIGTCILYFSVRKKLRERRWEKQHTTAHVSTGRAITKHVTRTPGFIEVVWCYMVALKERVCPTITFVTDPTEEDV